MARMEFISLSDVIESVASCVPIRDDWQEIHPPLPAWLPRGGDLRRSVVNGFAHKVYRDSVAVALLYQCIGNASPEQRPHWFDTEEVMLPTRSDAAYGEAIPLMKYAAQWANRFSIAFDEKRITLLGNRTQAHEGQFKNPENSQRFQELGFDRTEIIKFLNSGGILHSFTDDLFTESTGTDTEAIGPSDNPPALDQPTNSPDRTIPFSSSLLEATSQSAGSSEDKTDQTGLAHFSTTATLPVSPDSTAHGAQLRQAVATAKVYRINKQRRNELDAAIDEAIKRAGNDSTADVFLQLKEMVLEGVQPFTGDVTDGKLSYLNADNQEKTLNQSQLRSRLSRRRTPSSR